MNTKILGQKGENLAKKFLIKNKYKILEQNYKNKIGEIDIICYDKENDETIFVEVKTRESTLFGNPCEAVDYYKQKKIKDTAMIYLLKNKKTEDKFRFDVIEILGNEINHIKYAF